MAELTCICCPIGCKIEVQKKAGEYQISGADCIRGRDYALDEITAPKRIVTAVVGVAGEEKYVSVKTELPVPREKISRVLEVIRGITVGADTVIGEVVYKDIAGTGVDLIATKNA